MSTFEAVAASCRYQFPWPLLLSLIHGLKTQTLYCFIQTMKMVQCKSLTGQCMKPFVSGCESLCKIKLDARLRAYIPPTDVAALEARLCYIKWMDKG
jgi:hypothetical protein